MLRLSSKADISYDHCTKVVPRVITSKKQFWNANDLKFKDKIFLPRNVRGKATNKLHLFEKKKNKEKNGWHYAQ